LICEALKVEPEVERDAELDDADNDHQEQRQDQRELDQRLSPLALPRGGVLGLRASHVKHHRALIGEPCPHR
jgi:hypothetical protein